MTERGEKYLKIFIYFICVLIAIPFAGLVIILALSFKDIYFHDCEKGPLQSIASCKFDQSADNWMSNGWWYSDATGQLDEASCKIATNADDKLPMTENYGDKEHLTAIYKVPCDTFGVGTEGTCYAAQRMATNFNSRFVKVLIVKDCHNARYFEGSKYTIIDGQPAQPGDWTEPYENIPDENTGKLPEKTVYGQILRPETGA